MKANIGDKIGSYFEGKILDNGTRDFLEGTVVNRYINTFGFAQYEVNTKEGVKHFLEHEFYIIEKEAQGA